MVDHFCINLELKFAFVKHRALTSLVSVTFSACILITPYATSNNLLQKIALCEVTHAHTD